MAKNRPSGVGIGLRLQFAEELVSTKATNASFVEIAPENYLGVGGYRARLLAMAKERWPVVCHGLCGDLAGAAPLDQEYLTELKQFLRDADVHWYSDHLCYTHLAGVETHDLIALPLHEGAVRRAAKRIREVQSFLELPMAIENVSAYMRMPGSEMREEDFVAAVVREADCHLLLDINNVYVNSINFGFDAKSYVDALPLERVLQIHIAGHHRESEDLLIDTHGASIADPVYDLLCYTLRKMAAVPPILLERDSNIPPLIEIEQELETLRICVEQCHARA